ncbi:MAG: NUDIX domain-containing protein [Candidatus Pacebacteria bacterium]|nr:NUDIX domain-containing protein [Candidatus Paceibacterota bacterium]
MTGRLDDSVFRDLIKNAPLVSIDLIVKDPNRKIAVVRRTRNPAKGDYFVPGGRIYKGEELSVALKRIADYELRIDVDLVPHRFFGAFTHIYETNRFDESGYGTHYVVLAYEIRVERQSDFFDADHDEIKWITADEILASDSVNSYVKRYFSAPRFEFDTQADEYEHFVGAGIAYEALMAHYVHYDSQFWSRTQLLLAVQGGLFAASAVGGFANTLWASGLMVFNIFLTLAITNLIFRDTDSAWQNIDAIDACHDIISKNLKCTPLRLRSKSRFGKAINGIYTVKYVIVLVLILDVAWAFVNAFKIAPI